MYNENIADIIFKNNVKDILENGFDNSGQKIRPVWKNGDPAYTLKKFGIVNTYDLWKEFPAMTLRPIAFKSCIDEILWIWQKKSNNIKDLKSKIWDSWSDESGSIGKAYGYQLGRKIQFPEGEFDQVDWILNTLKNDKYSRRMITNIFNHDDLKEMGLQPCAYGLTLNVEGDYLNGILNQRSQDFIVANNWNVVQYAVLLHMFARASGLKVGRLIHVIADAHIYNKHFEIAKEMLDREIGEKVYLAVNPNITNFYDFKVEDFTLINYKPQEQIKGIEVAI